MYDMNCEPGHRDLAREQVSHPIDLYQPGSERLEKLYQQMAEANRFQWPDNLSFNL